MPLIKIHNIETDEVIEREMNEQELKAHEEHVQASLLLKEAETTKAIEKAALLAKLGITADEAKLLLS